MGGTSAAANQLDSTQLDDFQSGAGRRGETEAEAEPPLIHSLPLRLYELRSWSSQDLQSWDQATFAHRESRPSITIMKNTHYNNGRRKILISEGSLHLTSSSRFRPLELFAFLFVSIY